MTKEIREYVLEPLITIWMPAGAEILTAQEQDGDIYLWALVDPTGYNEKRTFEVYGASGPLMYPGHKRKYIATVQVNEHVFHVFEYIDI